MPLVVGLLSTLAFFLHCYINGRFMKYIANSLLRDYLILAAGLCGSSRVTMGFLATSLTNAIFAQPESLDKPHILVIMDWMLRETFKSYDSVL